MNQEEQSKKMSQLIAKCWVDKGFKQKLLTDPAATLKAEGVELPAGLSVKVLENTGNEYHLVIPAKPMDLSEVDLGSGGGAGLGGDVCTGNNCTARNTDVCTGNRWRAEEQSRAVMH